LYHKTGLAWLVLERYEKAASYFDAVSELAPDYAPAWERRAWALGLMGRYEAALECADRALALNARDPDAWNTKGKILLFSGEAAAARECFDRALARYPSSPEALLAKGVTYFAEAKYDQARPYFEELTGAGGSQHYLLYLYFIDRAGGRVRTDRLQPLLETPPDSWPKDISLFLVGGNSAEDLLAEAAGDEALLCEAHFFIGYKNKLDGDAAGARRHFGEAVATGQIDTAEYYLARYELRRSAAKGE
jgi:tetratricopeptide (TPR) repeat protein